MQATIDNKIVTYETALKLSKALRTGTFKIVITNGCFDILHAGHVRFLDQAKDQGDLLFVGVNSDASVATLKGPGRPINSLRHRMTVLAGLASVDYVMPIEGVRVNGFIRDMRAAEWVKGGDYTLATLDVSEVAAAVAADTGIRILPVVENVSTTAILQRNSTCSTSSPSS
jgi:rfaE bifunctional protein nucleotidyltransferase chain/domain